MPVTGSILEPNKSRPYPLIHSINIYFIIKLPSLLRASMRPHLFTFSYQNSARISHLCLTCTTPCPSHIPTCHHPINPLLFGEEFKLWKFSLMNILIMQFSHLLVTPPSYVQIFSSAICTVTHFIYSMFLP